MRHLLRGDQVFDLCDNPHSPLSFTLSPKLYVVLRFLRKGSTHKDLDVIITVSLFEMCIRQEIVKHHLDELFELYESRIGYTHSSE